jgi:hypothetical protein
MNFKMNLKTTLKSFAVVALAALPSLANAQDAPVKPNLINLPPQYVFAPQGYDDNDNVQITISGDLPSTCFKSGPATAEVDAKQKTITIKNQSYFYSGCWCLYVSMPFTKTIDVGVLPAGEYNILVETKKGEALPRGKFFVRQASAREPDDYVYALVEGTQVDPSEASTPAGAPKTLKISGLLTSNCMDLAKVKVTYRAPNVIEVQPIVKITNEWSCDSERRPFSQDVTLSPPWAGRTLVHIRSMNGQAVNLVTDF